MIWVSMYMHKSARCHSTPGKFPPLPKKDLDASATLSTYLMIRQRQRYAARKSQEVWETKEKYDSK
jgi:hypothetical protein